VLELLAHLLARQRLDDAAILDQLDQRARLADVLGVLKTESESRRSRWKAWCCLVYINN
jgi:hypothetical protein